MQKEIVKFIDQFTFKVMNLMDDETGEPIDRYYIRTNLDSFYR